MKYQWIISIIVCFLMTIPNISAFASANSISSSDEKKQEDISKIEVIDHSNDSIPSLINHDLVNKTLNNSIIDKNNLNNSSTYIDNSENKSTMLLLSEPIMDSIATIVYSSYSNPDNIIPIVLKVQTFIDSDYDQYTSDIPYALFYVFQSTCSGSLLYQGTLTNLGGASFTISGNTLTICVKVIMDDGRTSGYAAGYVTNPDGSTFYATTINIVYDYTTANTITLIIKKDDAVITNVGAAAVYVRMEEAKKFIMTYAWAETDIHIYWPTTTPSIFSTTPFHIDIHNNIAMENIDEPNYHTSWNPWYLDAITHEYAHVIQYRNYWTGGWISCSGNHNIEFQFNDGTDTERMQCAFAEGFADNYPSWVYNRDTSLFSSIAHVEGDNLGAGNYIRNPTLGEYSYGQRLKGEFSERNTEMVLWDIVDSTTSADRTYPVPGPAYDDDGANGWGQSLANVLFNYQPKTLWEFWDSWERYYYAATTPDYVSLLADIFMNNNCARFSHAKYSGQYATDSHGLASIDFEILSMNTKPIKDTSHEILIRFELRNTLMSDMSFSDIGIYTACTNPSNCDMGYKHPLYNILRAQIPAGSYYYEYVGRGHYNIGDVTWSMRPCYQTLSFHYCDANWNNKNTLPTTYIFSDNFEGSWLWTSWDANTDPHAGLDYWGKSNKRPDHGTYSAWVNANGVNHNGVIDDYDDDMMAYMKITSTHDLRYIYWKMQFNIWYEQEDCCDSAQFMVGTTGTVYSGSQTTWQAKNYDNSYYGNQQLTNVDIQFLFYSDYSVFYRGVYIDDFQIAYQP